MPLLKPTLTLNFSKAKKLDSRITFSRSETSQVASYIDSNGVVSLSDIGSPRFNHDPLTKICKGLLLEEASTNLMIYSSKFDFWDYNGASCTANNAVSPSGAVDADLITNLNNNGLVSWNIVVSASSMAEYFASIYIKPMSGQPYVTFNVYYVGNAEDNVDFNFSTMTVSNSPYPNDIIFEKFPNGWYRIGFRISSDSTASKTLISFRMWVSGRGAINNNSVLLWGAQLEPKTWASSYIPTNTTQVTRNSEFAYISGTNFTSWYNQTEGTFISYGIEAHGESPKILNVAETSMNNNNSHNVIISLLNTFQFLTYSDGIEQHNSQISKGSQKTFSYSPWAIASSIKTNSFSDVVDEVSIITDENCILPSVMNRLDIGLNLNGNISALLYYNEKLSDSELKKLATKRDY